MKNILKSEEFKRFNQKQLYVIKKPKKIKSIVFDPGQPTKFILEDRPENFPYNLLEKTQKVGFRDINGFKDKSVKFIMEKDYYKLKNKKQ